MRYLILILSLAFQYSYTQSVFELDKKYGFKDIRLDDPVSKYPVIYSGTGSLYRYTGTCCQDVFGMSINQLLFSVSNGRIESIVIIMPEGQGDRIHPGEPNYLDRYFERLFGEKTSFTTDPNTSNFNSQWVGKKVVLDIQYYYQGYKKGWQAVIAISKSTLDDF